MTFHPYRGYIGTIEWNEEDKVFFGQLENIEDLISYEAATRFELENEFHAAVDEYIVILESLKDS